MTTLAEWQSFARSTGLKGWSRLKKKRTCGFFDAKSLGRRLRSAQNEQSSSFEDSEPKKRQPSDEEKQKK